ncbi:hypothetical protein [Parvibaculum sp.]|jgi:hypothetical protein|uniref:hypothetical protein n=1 Tax=Parvibaculum sp. TaxID=2024848 RepID=UPI001B22DE2C|nr:hypothetical protein [Parvibaculum sp.]MBO6636331.1 hypothetical protein [Parvibaculum sp.]MBO6679208.1 hypothetical protein [Parvibaculum sp.]MBO6685934.1 hypothetical protein [Parvibaculum sp.]MBO6905962.1 hypothetical protein [Parvibaculum sp.]
MNTEHHSAHDDRGHHDAQGVSVSRRTLIVLGGTALLAAAVPGALFLAEPEGSGIAARDFVSLLADPDGAAALGNIWIGEGGADSASIVHEKKLAEALTAEGWTPGMGAEETHTALAAAVRADYDAARTVLIDNWMLSDTEARLCALAALLARDGDDEHSETHG